MFDTILIRNMDIRWKLKEVGDLETIKKLSSELNISNILSNMLVHRGIDSYEKARLFFRPKLDDLHDPFLLKDMDIAINRIIKAIDNNEKILIYGDYDVDGTTSVALFYSFLKKQYNNIDFYIPNRYTEGYGISYKGIDFAKENGFSLVISFDCGIKAIEQVKYANTLNIDFIITDHHIADDQLPDAIAVIDPKRPDCGYPEKNLSGCGVSYKLASGLAKAMNIADDVLHSYLDLVAISIAADIVPLIGENRTLAYWGLKRLNEVPRFGIQAIMQESKLSREITISDIVFLIAPRINAAGRIHTGNTAVELLIANDYSKASEFAKIINEDNITRKDLDAQITEDALNMLDGDSIAANKKATIVFNKDWHKGVVGIVASRLIDTYYRPTIVLTESEGLATGSARSVKGFDIYAALEKCSDLLVHFGGHMYAAGLAVKLENLDIFKKRFFEIVENSITEDMLTPEIEIDAEIDLKDITPKFYKILNQFAPFGPDNMKPVFVTSSVYDKGYAKVVGKNHLKLTIHKPDDGNGVTFDAIAFKQSEAYNNDMSKIPFDICYTIEENEWNGNINLQLNIRDIKK
ncbi:MAG: single-stranded-DNA-specific exonuclease RecJ [Bacteroidota bacterium]